LNFQLSLNTKDLNLLYLLKKSLGDIGCIYLCKGKNMANYSINSLEDLNVFIKYLEKSPLLTQKAGDFLLFRQAFNIIKNKVHLTKRGLYEIVNIKASMN